MPPSRDAPATDRAIVVDREIGLGSVIDALWRQRWTVVGCFVTTMLVGVLVILLSSPRYQASTSILLDPRLGKSVGADPTTPGFVADSSAIDSQVKLLTSQTVLSRVAATLHLEDDPEFSSARFSLLRALGLSGPAPSGVDLKTLENAVSIRRPERTYLVEIQASAATAEKAAAIANAVADAYNEDQISSRVVSARNDSRFIALKRDQLRQQIEAADRKIEAYKSANNIVSTDGLRSSEQQVADLTRELGTARGRASELKARADQIAAIARSGKFDASADALKSPTIERLRGSQADAERELAKLSETLGPRHPALIESRAQAQRVRELIVAELGRLRQSAENEFQVEKRNETQLVSELDRIKRQSTDTSSKIVPLRQLEREADALRQSDERFARIGDTLTQQEGDTPPARIVAAARPPVSPAWPKRTLILGLSAGAGLFLGVAAALFREGLARSRRGAFVPVSVERRSVSAAPQTAARDYWDDATVEPLVKSPVRDPGPAQAPAVVGRDAEEEERAFYGSLRAKSPHRRLVWS